MAPIKRKKNVHPKAKRKLFLYSPTKVTKALDAIRGGMPVQTASKTFHVPRTTLRHKIEGHSPESSGHVGPQAVLGKDAEDLLVQWIQTCAKMGFPINKAALFSSVHKMVTSGNFSTPFVNNRPGIKWFNSFMKRHPEISQKHAEYINMARAGITEEKIRRWFMEVKELLDDDFEVLSHPKRVFNMDETSFYLSPKGAVVLATRGEPVYDVSSNSDKENITTLITVNALGEIAPPLTVFKYERLPPAVAKAAPPFWGLGKTEKGWMTGESFYEYFANVFYPFLVENNIELPVIVFLDGHASHLTMHLTNFCKANGIILVCLYPNTTHILQPLDVAFFFPLKSKWREMVRMWRYEHDGAEIRKQDIPANLNKLLADPTFPAAITAGFKVCGLYPFNADAVDYKKCTLKITSLINESSKEQNQKTHLQYLESMISSEHLLQFRETRNKGIDWDGDIGASMAFDIWVQFVNDEETSKVPELQKVPTQGIFNTESSKQCDLEDGFTVKQLSTPGASCSSPPNLIPDVGQSSNCIVFEFEQFSDVVNNVNDLSETSSSNLQTETLVVQNETPSTSKRQPILIKIESHHSIEDVEKPSSIQKKALDMPTSQVQSTCHNGHELPQSTLPIGFSPVSCCENTHNVSLTKEISPKTMSEVLKDVIRWPVQTPPKNPRKRINMPSVLTSAKWREIYEIKEKEKHRPNKINKINKCREFHKQRPTISPSQLHVQKRKRSRKNSDISAIKELSDSDKEENPSSPNKLPHKGTPKEHDYVIVEYEGEFFPGQVLEIDASKKRAQVSVMTISGPKDWKWPDKLDVLWYPVEDVKEVIQPPASKNSRQACEVPEINKYRQLQT